MNLGDTTIWVNDLLIDEEIIEAIEDFGGIAAFHPNGLALSKYFDKAKNLYAIDNPDPDIKMRYMGEYKTNRTQLPYWQIDKYGKKYGNDTIFYDESSPYRVREMEWVSNHSALSCYRKPCFSIRTKKLITIFVGSGVRQFQQSKNLTAILCGFA